MPAIHTSVVAAFLDSGLRKAGTPLEMASMPVRATAPEEKPRRRRNRLSVPPVWTMSSTCAGSKGIGSMCPKYVRHSPMTTTPPMLTM